MQQKKKEKRYNHEGGETYSDEEKQSNKTLMSSRPCLTRRKLREWLPGFFTVPFETSRSSIACKVLCVLDASLRSRTCMHQKEHWIQEPHLNAPMKDLQLEVISRSNIGSLHWTQSQHKISGLRLKILARLIKQVMLIQFYTNASTNPTET